jgi:hypothetical protein
MTDPSPTPSAPDDPPAEPVEDPAPTPVGGSGPSGPTTNPFWRPHDGGGSS